jgi:O-antigen/teichoic acid export membrane protein
MPSIMMVKKIFHFSIFMFIESSAISLFQQFDKVLVGFTLGPSLAGVYSLATSVGLRLSIVVGSITEVIIPFSSRNYSGNELGDSFIFTIRKFHKYISIIVAALSSFGIIYMREIISIWLGQEYSNNYYQVFSIALVAYSLLSISRPGHQALTGMGEVKFTSTIYFISSSIMLISLFFISKKFSILGAVSANGLMVILIIMSFYLYQKIIPRHSASILLSDIYIGLLFPVISLVIGIGKTSIFQRTLFFIIISVLICTYFLRNSKSLLANIKDLRIVKNKTS